MKKRVSIPVIISIFLFTLSHAAPPDSYNKGIKALKTGNAKIALKFLTQAIESDPANYVIYSDRGVAHKKLGELDKAVSDYSKALEIKPDYVTALNNRGVAYTQLGDYEKALSDFQQALTYGNLQGKIHSNMATALAKSGKTQEALAEFELAASIDPLDGDAGLLMAELLENTGRKEEALKTYRKAFSVTSDQQLVNTLDKKMAALEKSMLKTTTEKQPAKVQTNIAALQPLPARNIVPAQPRPSSTKVEKSTNEVSANDPKSFEGIKSVVEAKATEKMLPASKEIIAQGLSFLENGEYQKALLRFEDVLQLERRAKNPLAVAACLMYIGQTHTKSGDYPKATAVLDEANNIFSKQKYAEGVMTVSILSALAKRSAGNPDAARTALTSVMKEAETKHWPEFAQSVKDLAENKPKPANIQIAKNKIAKADPVDLPDERPAVATDSSKPKKDKAPEKASSITLVQKDTSRTNQGNQEARLEVLPEVSVNKQSQAPEKSPQMETKVVTPEAKTVEKPVSGVRSLPGVKPDPIFTSPNSPRFGSVGNKPSVSMEAAKKSIFPQSASSPQKSAAKTEFPQQIASRDPLVAPEHLKPTIQSPKTETLREIKPVPPKLPMSEKEFQKKLAEELAELKRLKQSNDETKMISVLERLTEMFMERRDYDKALHGLAASLAFRQKTGTTTGIEKKLELSSDIKLKLDQPAGALEDLTRAIFLVEAGSGKNTAQGPRSKVKRITSELGLESTPILAAYNLLWQAKTAKDAQAETEAVYIIGNLLAKSTKPSEALPYFERSSASILKDKADLYEKLGQSHQANEAYTQALEAFKKFDYPKYLEMRKHEGPKSGT